MSYKQISLTYDALQYTGDLQDVIDFGIPDYVLVGDPSIQVGIPTSSGVSLCAVNNYIIRSSINEVFIVQEQDFNSFYQETNSFNSDSQSNWEESDNTEITYIKNKPVPSYSSPNFASITTATQLSTTKTAYVNYVFPTSMTSLLTSQSLTATLQYADDSGMTTNVVTVNVDVNGCSGILSLTLSGRLQVGGKIPAGKYRKVTLSQTGGATIPTTISSSQEELI